MKNAGYINYKTKRQRKSRNRACVGCLMVSKMIYEANTTECSLEINRLKIYISSINKEQYGVSSQNDGKYLSGTI